MSGAPPAPLTERRFTAVWCTQACLRELVLIYPTAAIMMQEQGISALELSFLFIIWSASAVLFEVPSGVLADRMSRHNVLVIAGAIEGLAFLTWLAAPEFGGYAAGFVVWSLASAMRSGTSQAFLHDTLAQAGRVDAFERIYGREQAASSAGVMLALLLGGWAAEGGYRLPLLASALAPWLAAGLVAVALREPPRKPLPADEAYFGTLAAGWREIRVGRGIAMIVAMMALLPTVYEVVEEYVPPLLHEMRFSLTAVGVAYGLAFGARVAAVLLAYRLRAADPRRLAWLFATGGAVLALGSTAGGYLAVLALCGYFALSAIGSVLLEGRLQRAITGHARATVTSVAGMLEEVLSLGFYLAIGLAAQHAGWQAAILMIGLWLCLSAVVFVFRTAADRS